MLFKKFIFLIFSFLCLASSININAKEEISFWTFWSAEWLQGAIAKFENENPNYTIKTERLTWSGGKNKLITALAAGYGPDVMEIGSSWAAEFITSGILAEFAAAEVPKDMFLIDSAKYQDKIYGLPWVISVAAIFYNKDLLAKNGFNVPAKTWLELENQTAKINNPADNIYGFGMRLGSELTWQRFLPFAWSNGADIAAAKNDAIEQYDRFVEAMSFYNNLAKNGLLDSNLIIRNAFLAGKIAYMIDDPGQYAYLKTNAPSLNFAVAPLPNSTKTNSHKTFAGAELLAVNSRSKNINMAKKFVNFMVQLKNAKYLTDKITSLFPADKNGLKSDFYTKDHKELLVFLDELNFSRSIAINQNWSDIQRILVLNVEKMLYNKLSPHEAADRIRKEVELILKY